MLVGSDPSSKGLKFMPNIPSINGWQCIERIVQFFLTIPLYGYVLAIPGETTPPTPFATATSTFAPTVTTTSSFAPSTTATPSQFIPRLDGTLYPQPATTISPENAARMVELARWGRGTVNEIAWSPDGKHIAVASSIGIYLYDPDTLKQSHFIETTYNVNSVAFSPDGRTLASAGSWDGTVKLLWNAAS